MAVCSKLTPLEKKLFSEAVIREYRMNSESHKHSHLAALDRWLKKTAQVNMVLGISASLALVYFSGWQAFFQLILTGIIWITIIASAMAAITKN